MSESGNIMDSSPDPPSGTQQQPQSGEEPSNSNEVKNERERKQLRFIKWCWIILSRKFT